MRKARFADEAMVAIPREADRGQPAFLRSDTMFVSRRSTEAAGGGEIVAEEAGGGPVSRDRGDAEGCRNNMVSARARRACTLLNVARSALSYCSQLLQA